MANNISFEVYPQSRASTVVAYSKGGQVNGAQSAVTEVVVHAGHGFATSDLFLYGETEENIRTDRVFTVSATTATSITFSGDAFSFPDDAVLVNLETDTVATNSDGSWPLPNYDGSDITMYTDSNGDDSLTEIPVGNDGSTQFWVSSIPVWVLAKDRAGRPVKVYKDIGFSAGTDHVTVTRGTTAPSSPSYGDIWIDTSGSYDIEYVRLSDGTSDVWIERITGETA